MPRPCQAYAVTDKPFARLLPVAFARNQAALYQQPQVIRGLLLRLAFDMAGKEPAVGVWFFFQFGQDEAYQIPVALHEFSSKFEKPPVLAGIPYRFERLL